MVETNFAGARRFFGVLVKKEKLRVTDAYAIAVLQLAPPDGHVVHKRAVAAAEICNDESIAVFFDYGMAPRD
jgi:hypothetical protein